MSLFQWGKTEVRTSSLGASKRGFFLDSRQEATTSQQQQGYTGKFRFKTVSQDWKHALILQPGVRRKFFRSLCGVVPSTRTAFVVSVVWWRGCLPLDKYGYCLQRESHGGAVPDNGRVHRQAPCFAIFAYIVQYVHYYPLSTCVGVYTVITWNLGVNKKWHQLIGAFFESKRLDVRNAKSVMERFKHHELLAWFCFRYQVSMRHKGLPSLSIGIVFL